MASDGLLTKNMGEIGVLFLLSPFFTLSVKNDE